MSTTPRTSSVRRPLRSVRGALLALLVGGGIALTPLPALAGTTTAAPAAAPAAAAGSRAAQIAVATALAQRGKPFAWGASGPDRFDCSGLAQYAYRAAGIALPHSSRAQSTLGRPVSRTQLQPGDLLFFFHPVQHVSIYIGNGQMVYAPDYGDVVKVRNVSVLPFNTARRIA